MSLNLLNAAPTRPANQLDLVNAESAPSPGLAPAVPTTRPLSRLLGFWILSLLYLYFTYAPVVTIPFAHHDQYRFFNEDSHVPREFKARRQNDTAYLYLRMIGRPLMAETQYQIFRQVNGLRDLNVVRAVTLGLTAIAVAFLAAWLCRFGLHPIVALCASASIYTLPAHQVCVYMTVPEFLIADFAAFGAFRSLNWMPGSYRGKRIWGYLIAAGRIPLALALLLVALLIYPCRALLFSFALCALVLFSRPITARGLCRALLFNLGMLAAASVCYFYLVRLVYCPPALRSLLPPNASMRLCPTPLQRLSSFLTDIVPADLNVWNIYFSPSLAFAVGLGLAAVFGLAIARWLCKSGNGQELFRRVAIGPLFGAAVVGVFASSELVYLAAPVTQSAHRMHFAGSAIIVLLLIAGGSELCIYLPQRCRRQFLTGFALAVLAVGGMSANYNMTQNALNDYLELSFLATEASKGNPDSPPRSVQIVPAQRQFGYNGLPTIYDEFNMNTLSENDFLQGTVRTALLQAYEANSFILDPRVGFKWLDRGVSPQAVPATQVVVNMNDLVAPGGRAKESRAARTKEIAFECVEEGGRSQVSAARNSSSKTGNWTQVDLGGTWELGPWPYPCCLRLVFKTGSARIEKYALCAGHVEPADWDRMPLSWTLEGSVDGVEWTRLDARGIEPDWRQAETRVYEVAYPGRYSIYQIRFTGGEARGCMRLNGARFMTGTDASHEGSRWLRSFLSTALFGRSRPDQGDVSPALRVGRRTRPSRQ
jgi:hypothetical protein